MFNMRNPKDFCPRCGEYVPNAWWWLSRDTFINTLCFNELVTDG